MHLLPRGDLLHGDRDHRGKHVRRVLRRDLLHGHREYRGECLCFLFRGPPAANRGAEIRGHLVKKEAEAKAMAA